MILSGPQNVAVYVGTGDLIHIVLVWQQISQQYEGSWGASDLDFFWFLHGVIGDGVIARRLC